MYQHIFFDLDHTLWDFDKNSEHTMYQLYQRFDLATRGIKDFDVFFEVFKTHNDKLWTRFRKGYMRRDEMRWKLMWHTLLDFKIGNTKIANEMSIAYVELLPTQKILIPFAKEAVAHCAAKYKLHIITNGFETTQRQKLHYSGLSEYFEQVITSEKCNCIKPQRGIFDFASQKVAAEKEHCIMIGDAVDVDILGAINADWDCIYYNPKEKIHQYKPTHEIVSLEKILEIL